MKDSSGDWDNTRMFLHEFSVGRRHDESATREAAPTTKAHTAFDVFVGSESFLLANMRNGGVGTISATANVNPAAIYELYVACTGGLKFENDEPKLERLQARLNVV